MAGPEGGFIFRKPQGDPEREEERDEVEEAHLPKNVVRLQTPPGIMVNPATGEVIRAVDGDDAARKLRMSSEEQREAA